MLVLHVHQLHLVVHAVGGVFVIGEYEVEDAHGIYTLELEVPVAALLCLIADGEGGIEHASVLEIVLLGLLHLDDEVLSCGVLAVHVEDGFPVHNAASQLFGVAVSDVSDFLLVVQE